METITIRPKSKKESRFFRTLLENLRWEAEVEYGAGEAPYDLKALNRSVMEQKEAGSLKTVNPKNIWADISFSKYLLRHFPQESPFGG